MEPSFNDRVSGEAAARTVSPARLGEYIYENSPLGIAVAELDGRFRLANSAYQRMTGYSEAELLEQAPLEMVVEDDRPAALDRLNQLAAGTVRQFQAEKRCRCKDGNVIWVRVTRTRIPAPPELPQYVLAIAEDITERKRTEGALREGEQRLLQLAEHICEVLWVVDFKIQRVLYVSPAYERIWGRPCESLYQDMRSFIDAIHPEDRQPFLDGYEDQVRNPRSRETKYRVIRPDGSIRWIQDRSFPVLDAAGEVHRFVGIAEDITKRKRAEERLRRSEAYLAESERLSHIGTWAVNIPSREIAFWSTEHYRIFGFDPEKSPPTVEAALVSIHPEDSAIRETIARSLGEPKDFEMDFRLLLPDGSIRHVNSLGHPVLNDAGELMEFVGMAMDVTERKLVEDDLQHLLAQHRALAARLEGIREEERTRLARELHDELGQSLTAIKMGLSFLCDHRPQGPERARRWQAVLKLIDDTMLSVQKISTELRPGMLDDLGLVAALESEAREFARRAGTKCALDLPGEDIEMEPGVSTALFRIFQEALTNIARHSQATEFSVRLAEDGGGLRLEVSDNGRGFDPTGLPQTGSLGILGMRERALLLDGRLDIGSSPGGGASVIAWIPRRRKEEPGIG